MGKDSLRACAAALMRCRGHCLLTVCSTVHAHCVLAVCSPYARCMLSECSLYAHCMLTVYSVSAHCMLTVCSAVCLLYAALCAHCALKECSPYAHRMLAVCSLYAALCAYCMQHFMLTVCSTVCSLCAGHEDDRGGAQDGMAAGGGQALHARSSQVRWGEDAQVRRVELHGRMFRCLAKRVSDVCVCMWSKSP